MIRRILHWLAHRLHLQRVTVEAWYEGDLLKVGARCVTCGKIGRTCTRGLDRGGRDA